MNAQWRLFLAALGWVTRGIEPASAHGTAGASHQASRFVPVVGICIGLLAAAVYWGAAQVWPASVAVVLSMLAAALPTARRDQSYGALYWVFVLFIKYNVLMALSAADVPLPLPAYWGLGLIMIAAQAASRSLVVSVMAAETPSTPGAGTMMPGVVLPDVLRVTHGDLGIALVLGLAPAALLGIPGLIGLVAAIVMRLGLAYLLPRFVGAAHERSDITQQLTELCFYLGALASWRYV